MIPTIEHSGCWTIETLGGSGASAVSFVLDTSGGAHLAYIEGEEAIYARVVIGGYERTVTGNADARFESKTDLALGPDGSAHVYYYMAVGSGPGDQIGHAYATNVGGSFIVKPLRDWYSKTIDDVSLLVDQAGAVHFLLSASDYSSINASYMDNEVAYVKCTGADCETPRVLFAETAPFACDDLALARGPAGRLDALWVADATNSFLYRPNVAGADVAQTILSGYHASGSLALDTTGDAVVALADNHNTGFADHLQVATNRTGSWVIEDVPMEPVPYSIYATSVAVDSADHIHVAAFADGIKYATNSSGSWVVTQVAAASAPPVLRIDGGGHVHIAWGSAGGARHAVCSD